MKKNFYLIILLLTSLKMYAQDTEKKEVTIKDFIPSYIENQESDHFNLYAVNYDKMWFFIVDHPDESIVLTLKKDSLVQMSTFLEDGMQKVISKYGFRPSNKSVNVNDLILNPYYTFNKKGSEAFKMILYLEFGYDKKTRINQWRDFLLTPFSFLSAKQTAAEKELKKMNSYKNNVLKTKKKYELISDQIL